MELAITGNFVGTSKLRRLKGASTEKWNWGGGGGDPWNS